jgi:16S rRNA processing protein RimM
MPGSRRDFVVIGEIAKPHGVKGEMRVFSHADSLSLFSELPRVFLARGGRPKAYGVRAARPHKDFVLLTLEGVEDRDAAEALRGAEVRIPVDMLPEPGEDELYQHAVLGLEVRLEDGQVLGFVEYIDTRGDSEVWTVVTGDGSEVLLPIAEEFVVSLDLDAGYVVMDPPPGLIELYLGGEAKE